MEDLIKQIIANGEDKAADTSLPFPEFMEQTLKNLFGDQVSFVKVKEVDDGKNDIHIDIKEAETGTKWTEAEKEALSVIKEEEIEQVKHLVRKIAQNHKAEMPLEGVYSAVGALLAIESEKLMSHKQKAQERANKKAMLKKKIARELAHFSDEEIATLKAALDDLES